MSMRRHVVTAVDLYNSGMISHRELCMHLAEINDLVQAEPIPEVDENTGLGCWSHKLNTALNRSHH